MDCSVHHQMRKQTTIAMIGGSKAKTPLKCLRLGTVLQ